LDLTVLDCSPILTKFINFSTLFQVEAGSFRHLPNLATLILTHNRLDTIDPTSFACLDNLQKIELQYNRLTEFSLGAFENCTKFPQHPLTLNVSHNRIVHMTPPPLGANFLRVPHVERLDASSNVMRQVPKSFIEFLSPSLRVLDLSRNRLVTVEGFGQLSMLQILRIAHNVINSVAKTAFHSLTSLQVRHRSLANIHSICDNLCFSSLNLPIFPRG
jgi:Leucine-rich repeat (LRR) protein